MILFDMAFAPLQCNAIILVDNRISLQGFTSPPQPPFFYCLEVN